MARAHGGQRGAGGGRRDADITGGIELADAARDHNPEALLATLTRLGVRFVLVGGLASNVHGYDRTTDDVDVTPARDVENLRRLARALTELGAQWRVPDLVHGVPATWDERSFKQPSLTLVTKVGFLDLAFEPDGTGGYVDLVVAAKSRQVLGVTVVVAALPDIIRSKTAANRPKDHDALPDLRRLANQDD